MKQNYKTKCASSISPVERKNKAENHINKSISHFANPILPWRALSWYTRLLRKQEKSSASDICMEDARHWIHVPATGTLTKPSRWNTATRVLRLKDLLTSSLWPDCKPFISRQKLMRLKAMKHTDCNFCMHLRWMFFLSLLCLLVSLCQPRVVSVSLLAQEDQIWNSVNSLTFLIYLLT